MSESRSRILGIGLILAAAQIAILMSAACASLGIVQGEKDRPLAEAIRGRKQVRVFTPEGPTRVLRPAVTSDGLEGLAPKTREPIRLALADIRSVQVRKGGIAKGLSVGAGAGLAVGLAAGAVLLRASEGEFEGGTVLLGGIAGTAAGALTGALAGSLFHGWKTVYRANGGFRPVPAFSLAPARGGGLAMTLAVGF